MMETTNANGLTIRQELERDVRELRAKNAAQAERIEKLEDAVRDALGEAKANWEAVNNHPASRHGKGVRYYTELLGGNIAEQALSEETL